MLVERYTALKTELDGRAVKSLSEWPAIREQYSGDVFEFSVRDKVLSQPFTTTSLSGTAFTSA